MRSLLVIALLASFAHAQPASPPAGSPAAKETGESTPVSTKPTVAISVNMPFMWIGKQSLAASFFVGVTERLALRFNAAYYVGLEQTINLGEASLDRRTLDTGVGLVYFLDERFRGLSLELGALRRSYWQFDETGLLLEDEENRKTIAYAGRALLGYNWFSESTHLFMAVAVGLSVGYERGTESRGGEYMEAVHKDISEVAASAEGYWRIGFAF